MYGRLVYHLSLTTRCAIKAKCLFGLCLVASLGLADQNPILVSGGGATLQSAIESAPAGATILVSPGTYSPIRTEGKALHIKAIGGPSSTTIDAMSAARCATLTEEPGATFDTVLEGFTLRNGCYDWNVVENNYGNGGGGVLGGTLINCRIERCTATTFGGGASHSVLIRTAIEECSTIDESYSPTFSMGGGAFFCNLYDCLVTGNQAGTRGGGIDDSIAVNCTIVDNCTRFAAVDSASNVNYNYTGSTGGGSSCSVLINCVVWNNRTASWVDSVSSETISELANGVNNYDGGDVLISCCSWPKPSYEFVGVLDNLSVGALGTLGENRISVERNTTITNPPSFVGAKDYRLRLGSPCIDAGRAHAKFNDADLNGNNRQVGTAIDIGCYEFQRKIDIPSGGDGAGRSISVPMDYIEEKAAPLLAEHGGDYEAAALAPAANGLNKVWECYVAGLSPTNATDVFRTVISMENGEPVIGWKPDLNEGGTKHERVYTVEGRESLTDGNWGPTNAASRFFRVKVSMP